MKMFSIFVFVLLLGTASTVSATPLDSKLKQRLTAYRASVLALEKGIGKLEPVFEEGISISKVLLTSEGNGTVLEELSETDRAFVEAHFKGFTVNVEEVILAEPQPDFFITLATELKDEPSLAYFKLFKQWKPNGVWPAYTRVQVDYGGCTEYGKLLVTNTYLAAAKFKKQFPGHFASEVKNITQNLEIILSESRCACGAKASVETELHSFLHEFPSETVSSKVKDRLSRLKNGEADFDFNCTVQ